MRVSGNQAPKQTPKTCVLRKQGECPQLIPPTLLTKGSQFKAACVDRITCLENTFTFFRSSRSIFSIPSSWSTLEARVGEESLLQGTRDKVVLFFFKGVGCIYKTVFNVKLLSMVTQCTFSFLKRNGSFNKR